MKEQFIAQLQAQLEMLMAGIKHESLQIKNEYNLANGQLFLLVILSKKGISRATDIANIIGITSGAVTGMSDKLVSLGLINRERSEEDRRIVLLSLTDKGQEVIAAIRSRRFERLRRMFDPLSDTDLEQITAALTKLNDLILTQRSDKGKETEHDGK